MFDLIDLGSFLDLRFLTAVPSALAGAGLGAWTAQWIAARNKKTDERLKEIRAANAAATIAYGITDHMLGMKHQIIKPVVDQFAIDRERFIQADALPKPPGATVIIFNAGLPHIPLQLVTREGVAGHRLRRRIRSDAADDGAAGSHSHALYA